jgi:formylglycine-generating enzyme required for sulfatase activity
MARTDRASHTLRSFPRKRESRVICSDSRICRSGSPLPRGRTGAACILTIAAAIVAATAHAQRSETTDPLVRPNLEAEIAELKAKTAALVASALPRLAALSPQERLTAAPEIWHVPGALTEFRDCAGCPHMVVIPAGEFTMGSPPAEQQAEAQHRVTIAAPFAVSKFEITFDEWDACVRDGGCDNLRPNDEGWGRGQRPVIHMSFDSARLYVTWLGRKTGKRYRLLSEAEWEYGARAGTTTTFAFGDALSPGSANFNGSTDGSGPSDANRQKTMPVGSFPPNAFGLHDMHGNISEWVEDCWHNDYTEKAPTDGSAWVESNCTGRVLRGGSWEDSDVELRSAARVGEYRYNSSYVDGLRVARSL